MVITLMQTMLVAYAFGAVASLVLSRRWGQLGATMGHACTVLGALAGLVTGVTALFMPPGSTPDRFELPGLFPFSRLTLQADGLSGFFLLIISMVALAAAIYAPAYLEAHHPAGRVRRRALHSTHITATQELPTLVAERTQSLNAFLLNIFVLSMSLVVCAADAFLFLLLWEAMTLASYFLVTSNRRDPLAVRAGFIYVVMAHVGTAFILFAFVFLQHHAGTFDFATMREAAATLPESTRLWLFMALLVGFSTKAGLIPLHVWLPLAHPAAPSHVSALMSGVMLKTAVYGMLRFGLGMLGSAPSGVPASWGWVVLGLGVLSAVLGVLYAFQEHDLKKFLAYCSIENMGVIFMALGAALLFMNRSMPLMAALAMSAALFHTLSHAICKSMLFLGAGSVQVHVHSLNMEDLGGLIRKMPWTAGLFLVGSVGIASLPPLTGFVSEWLTLQVLILNGASAPTGLTKLLGAGSAAMLALTTGVAAACFVKAFGVTFLARARTNVVEHAYEAPPSMLSAMGVLAVLSVVVGVLPGWLVPLMDGATAAVLPGHLASSALLAQGPLVMVVGNGTHALPGAAVGTGIMAAFLVVSILLVGWFVVRKVRGATRHAETWTCGMTPHERFAFTGFALSKAFRLIFKPIHRPSRKVTQTFHTPYIHARVIHEGSIQDVFQRHLYQPANVLMLRVAHRIRALHTGGIHAYIASVLLALVVSLFLFARG